MPKSTQLINSGAERRLSRSLLFYSTLGKENLMTTLWMPIMWKAPCQTGEIYILSLWILSSSTGRTGYIIWGTQGKTIKQDSCLKIIKNFQDGDLRALNWSSTGPCHKPTKLTLSTRGKTMACWPKLAHCWFCTAIS